MLSFLLSVAAAAAAAAAAAVAVACVDGLMLQLRGCLRL